MRRHQIIKAIISALFLTASLNLAAQQYLTIRDDFDLQRLSQEHPGITVCRFGPSIDEASRFYIELALMTAFIGVRLKRLQGRLFYFAGLSGTAVTYFFWWKCLFRIAARTGSEIESIHHLAYLSGANYWDICIAFSITLLLLWEFGRIIFLRRRIVRAILKLS